jgi:hypothetical protein
MRGEEARALWLLGEIARRGDPLDIVRAEAHYHPALALAEQLDMRRLQAHCHLRLGRLYGHHLSSASGERLVRRTANSTSVELVAEHLVKYAKLVGRENVIDLTSLARRRYVFKSAGPVGRL